MAGLDRGPALVVPHHARGHHGRYRPPQPLLAGDLFVGKDPRCPAQQGCTASARPSVTSTTSPSSRRSDGPGTPAGGRADRAARATSCSSPAPANRPAIAAASHASRKVRRANAPSSGSSSGAHRCRSANASSTPDSTRRARHPHPRRRAGCVLKQRRLAPGSPVPPAPAHGPHIPQQPIQRHALPLTIQQHRRRPGSRPHAHLPPQPQLHPADRPRHWSRGWSAVSRRLCGHSTQVLANLRGRRV